MNSNGTKINLPSKQKVIFLGDQGVGKTSILNRFLKDEYDDNTRVSNF